MIKTLTYLMGAFAIVVISILGSVLMTRYIEPVEREFVSVDARAILLAFAKTAGADVSDAEFEANLTAYYDDMQRVLARRLRAGPVVLNADLVLSGARDITSEVLNEIAREQSQGANQ